MSDLDSTESDEMTAEAQNQSNAEADDVHSLLSNFMQAKDCLLYTSDAADER